MNHSRPLLACLAVMSLARAAPAQDPAPDEPELLLRVASSVTDQVRVTGVAVAMGAWNLADPPGHKNQNLLRVNDSDHASFTVSYAKLGLYREVSGDSWDAGFRVEVGAGRMVEGVFSLDPDFNGGSEINLVQGHAQLQAPGPFGPLLLSAGRTYGWFGVESLDLVSNPNLSLSYFANFTPYTNTGVWLGSDLPGGLRYTQFVVNGWDLVLDQNDAQSYGGQLTWSDEQLGLTVVGNWLVGAEQPGNESDLRWLTELDVTWRPTAWTELRGALHYGQEEGAALGGGTAKYGGVMAIARQVLLRSESGVDRLAVAGRLTWWRDQGGSKTGLDQGLVEATATLELGFTAWAKLRCEYRHDSSSESGFFLGHRGLPTRRHQDTLAIDLAVSF